jgi:hypothetical protein
VKLASIFNVQNPIPHNCSYTPLEIKGKSYFVYSNSTSKPLTSDLLQNSTISHKYEPNISKLSDLNSKSKIVDQIPKYFSSNSYKAQQVLLENYGYVHPSLNLLPKKISYTTPALIDNKSKFVPHSPENMDSDELSKFINTFSALWCSRTIFLIDKFGQKPLHTIILTKTVSKTYLEQNSQNLIFTEYSNEHDEYVYRAMEACNIDKKDFLKYKLFSLMAFRTHLDGDNMGISFIDGGKIIHNKYVCKGELLE